MWFEWQNQGEDFLAQIQKSRTVCLDLENGKSNLFQPVDVSITYKHGKFGSKPIHRIALEQPSNFERREGKEHNLNFYKALDS